jgi:NADPH:quinone reductase-like Zn-dependent oxidoreductase
VKAVQLIAHGAPGTFELRDLPEPRPGANEVVVQVEACGLNHLDLCSKKPACLFRCNFRELPAAKSPERFPKSAAA